MPDGDNDNGRVSLDEFEVELRRVRSQGEPTALAQRPIDSVAIHDFAFYEFVLPTESAFGGPAERGLSDQALAYLDTLEARGIASGMLDLLAEFLSRLEGAIRIVVNAVCAPEWRDQVYADMLQSLYNDAPWLITELFAIYTQVGVMRRVFILDLVDSLVEEVNFAGNEGYPFSWWMWEYHAAHEWFVPGQEGRERQLPDWTRSVTHRAVLAEWRRLVSGDAVARLSQEYPFEVFPPLTVNVGLRVVYRQEWRSLGLQKGEIVRTVPLGPGQREKVSTKIFRRRRHSRTLESVTATETTTETTDTTKDSSEIVAEASSTFNWKVDAEVHGGIAVIGGSVSTSLGGGSEEKSRATSSSLSEAMRKAASKVRRETKVVVSTEQEETFERETASEIQNPNNETAITYEYHKLQQQYEVFTHLAEVESVIFVAERLPSPAEIGDAWVRRHDWIIARVLKDESHRATLNELIQDRDDENPVAGLAEDPFARMAGAAHDSFAKFNQTAGQGDPQGQGLSIPDIYAEPQRIYQQHLRDQAARTRANELRRTRRDRLYQHIVDNILHYCRAIWMAEDPDQRMLRYKKEGRRVPVEWVGPSPFVIVGAAPAAPPQYQPTGATAPLWDLIDPTGPIAYVGNYAVFGLRPRPQPAVDGAPALRIAVLDALRNDAFPLSLEDLLAQMRQPYLGREGDLRDPALTAFEREAARTTNADRRRIGDARAIEIASLLPEIEDRILDGNGQVLRDVNAELQYQITEAQWARYLYLKNATRRFLVDMNNLYLSIRVGEGAALEPFKRAHRYIDVLKAAQELEALSLKNQRRAAHLNTAGEYDPDVQKVIVVEDGLDGGAGPRAATFEALGTDAGGTGAPAPRRIAAPEEVPSPGDGSGAPA
jgi:hypothetical protein